MPISGGIVTAPIDVYRDLGVGLLGQNTGDLGYIIQSAYINKWAKFKPVRLNSVAGPTADQLRTLRYGIDFSSLTEWDSEHDSTMLSWGYLRPRGIAHNEPFRVLDFTNPANRAGNGYNHNAIPPINRTGTGVYSGTASPDGGQFFFDLEAILATGPNVELTLDLFPSVFTQSYYLGLCFSSDTRPDEVWWTSVPVTLAQLLSGAQLPNPSYYIPFLNAPYWQDGDDVIACYCLAPRALINDQTSPSDPGARSTDPTGIIPIVPAAGYGSWQYNIKAYTISKVIALYSNRPKIDPPISPNMRSDYVEVTGINFEVQTGADTELYDDSEVYVVFRAYLNGAAVGNDVRKMLSKNQTLQGETITVGGYWTESIQDLIQDNYLIDFEVQAWLERAPSTKKRLFWGNYNVNSGVTVWHTPEE